MILERRETDASTEDGIIEFLHADGTETFATMTGSQQKTGWQGLSARRKWSKNGKMLQAGGSEGLA